MLIKPADNAQNFDWQDNLVVKLPIHVIIPKYESVPNDYHRACVGACVVSKVSISVSQQRFEVVYCRNFNNYEPNFIYFNPFQWKYEKLWKF